VFISTFHKRNECKKFKHIIPAYIDYLREMFHSVIVDGRSSCIPEEYTEAPGDAYGDEYSEATCDDYDTTLNSPLSTNSHKRDSNTTDTTNSPHKKSKNPMVKAIKGLIEILKEGNGRDRDILLQARQQNEEELKNCINLVVDCGATEDRDEFLMATELFEKKHNRVVFTTIKTKEGRLRWLKWK
jgi:hypothetical protein